MICSGRDDRVGEMNIPAQATGLEWASRRRHALDSSVGDERIIR